MSSLPKVYSWDKPERKAAAASAASSNQGYDTLPEQEDQGTGWADDSSDEDQEPLDPTQQFLEYLLWNNQRGHMSAKQICTVAYWASLAGAAGMDVLAVNPASSGGNFQKKVDQYMGDTASSQKGLTYVVSVPAYIPSTGARDVWDLHTMPPHEVLACAHEGERTRMVQQLQKALDEDQMPPVYTRHPVVQAAQPGSPVLPLALFMDGVRYGKKGSILGITIQSSFPGSRKYLSVALRKSKACSCGCARWCTLWPVFQMLKWSLECLSTGKWPLTNHLGESWTDVGDTYRAGLAGTDLPFQGALVQVRCDWAELAHTLGFPSWSSADDPCPLCHVTKKQMQTPMTVQPTMEPFNWKTKTWDEYCQACSACEVVLEDPSQKTWSILQKKMDSVHKAKSGHAQGRILTVDVKDAGLQKEDRFEPAAGGLWDWNDLQGDRVQGTKVVFWRTSAEWMTKHRNPLFQAYLGSDVFTSMAIDSMHTWCLGIHQQFISGLLWKMLSANLFFSTSPSQTDRNVHSMSELNKLLLSFYKKFEKKEGHQLSRIELRVEMLGTKKANLELHAKAAETLGLLMFFGELLPTLQSQWPESSSWSTAANSLLRLWRTCQTQPLKISRDTRQELARCMHACWGM